MPTPSECPYCEGWGCRCLGLGSIDERVDPTHNPADGKPNQWCWCPASNTCPECKGAGHA